MPLSASLKVDFTEILAWYQRQCDNGWEHHYGVRLETLDNPEWLLTIDLAQTELEGKDMPEIREGVSPEGHPVAPRWLHGMVTEQQFRAACDPSQVSRLFQSFDAFIERHRPSRK